MSACHGLCLAQNLSSCAREQGCRQLHAAAIGGGHAVVPEGPWLCRAKPVPRSRATAPRSRSRAQVSAITWPMQLECSDCIGTDVVRAVNICGSRLRHTRHLQHCTCHETTLLSCHQLLAAQLRLSLGHAHVHWRGASTLISILNPKQHLQSVSARHVSAKHGCVGNIR